MHTGGSLSLVIVAVAVAGGVAVATNHLDFVVVPDDQEA